MTDGRSQLYTIDEENPDQQADEPAFANGLQINPDGSLENLETVAKLLLPEYDDLSNAPDQKRSAVYVTGDGPDAEGIYKNDGTSYQKVGGSGGAFEDTDSDGVAELQDSHASFEGGDARNILGLSYSPTEVTDTESPYTTQGESVLYVDTTNGAVEIVLASADAVDGHTVQIYDVGESAGTNAITISTEGSETINPGAQSSITISLNGGYTELINRAGNWFTDRHAQKDVVDTGALTIGGKLYEEDANSPFTATSTSSASYTLAGNYDEVIVIPQRNDVGFDRLQLNGKTDSNYGYIDNADTQTTGATEWPHPYFVETGSITVALRKDADRALLNVFSLKPSTGNTKYGNYAGDAITSIDTLDFFDSGGSTRSASARVYGRNMNV